MAALVPFTGATLAEPTPALHEALYIAERNDNTQALAAPLTAASPIRAEARARHAVLAVGLEPVSEGTARTWLEEIATVVRQTDTLVDQVRAMIPFAMRHPKVCFTRSTLGLAANWTFFPDYAALAEALRPIEKGHSVKVRALAAVMNAPEPIPEAKHEKDPARARALVLAMKAEFGEKARARNAAEAAARTPYVPPPPTEAKLARDALLAAHLAAARNRGPIVAGLPLPPVQARGTIVAGAPLPSAPIRVPVEGTKE